MSAAPVQPVPQRSAASVVRTLHGVLMLGVVAATVTFIALVHVAHVGPLMPGLAIAGYALALVSLLDIVIALLLRSKIPARSKDQTTDAYWGTRSIRTSAILTWVLFEAAALLPAVGYLITGAAVDLVAIAAALVAFAWTRPDAMERIP